MSWRGLIDELVSLGHEVTLFASGDSVTTAQLHAVWPRALRLGRPRTDPMVAQAVLLEAVGQKASEFDVIHAHIDWLHLPLFSRLGVPFLTTCHGRLDLPGFPDVVSRFPEAPFVSISDNQRVPLHGWAPCITGFHQTCFAPLSSPVPILLSLVGSCARSRLMHCNKKVPYSITLSARTRNDSGMFKPSVLAVLKLTNSSNRVGCCTGRSPGSAPLSTGSR